jgi:hypothetical protein
VKESTWYRYLTYPSGRAVPDHGSGDVVSVPSAASRVHCGVVARFGHDDQRDLGSGRCPQRFSIVGYDAGDLWGCVAAWYTGAWHTGAADGYSGHGRRLMRSRTWPDPTWREDKPGCTRAGCPGPDRL